MPLKKEFEYYLENQDSLVDKYNGKYIVIKNLSVIGVYDDELEAVQETSKIHELGTFLVQKCEPGTGSYTQRHHSRVRFEVREYNFDKLKDILIGFERKYKLSSIEMFSRYIRGEKSLDENMGKWVDFFILYLGTYEVRRFSCP